MTWQRLMTAVQQQHLLVFVAAWLALFLADLQTLPLVGSLPLLVAAAALAWTGTTDTARDLPGAFS